MNGNRDRRRRLVKFSERLTIVMDEAMRGALERRADELGVPMSEVARKILAEKLMVPDVRSRAA